MSQVKENNTVKVNYTGKLSDGQVFDSSEGKEPIEFTLGQGQLIPGFEKGLIDMELNEKKTITIPSSGKRCASKQTPNLQAQHVPTGL